VRLLLPGELAKHAVSEGTKAVTKYSSAWNLDVVPAYNTCKLPLLTWLWERLHFSLVRFDESLSFR
jgi:hypothetical protein